MTKVDNSKTFLQLATKSKVDLKKITKSNQEVNNNVAPAPVVPPKDEPVVLETTANIDIDDFNDEIPQTQTKNVNNTVQNANAQGAPTQEQYNAFVEQMKQRDAEKKAAEEAKNKNTDVQSATTESANKQKENGIKNTVTSEDLFFEDFARQEEIVSVENVARQFNMTPEQVASEAMNIQQANELTQNQALLVMRSNRMGEDGTAQKIINKAHEENTATMKKYSDQYGISAEDARLLFRAENGLEPAISKYAQLNNVSMLDALKNYKNVKTVTTEDLVAQADKNTDVQPANTERPTISQKEVDVLVEKHDKQIEETDQIVQNQKPDNKQKENGIKNTVTSEDLFFEDFARQEEIVSVENVARQFNMTPEQVAAEAMNIQQANELTQKQALLVMRSNRMGEDGTTQKIIDKAHEENTATMKKYSDQYGISAEDARLLFRAENGLEPVISKYAQLNNVSMLDALKKYKNVQTVTTENLFAQADKNTEVETTNQEQKLTVVSVADELGLSYQEVGSQMGQLLREQDMNQQQALRYIKALATGNDELAQSILDSVANTKQNEATQQVSNTTNSEEVKTITTEDLFMQNYENEVANISVEAVAQQINMEPQKVAEEMVKLQKQFELTPQQALLVLRASNFKENSMLSKLFSKAHADNTATMKQYSEQYGISADDARLLFRAENGLEPQITKYAQLRNVSLVAAVRTIKNVNQVTTEELANQQNYTILSVADELGLSYNDVGIRMSQLMREQGLTQQQALAYMLQNA